MLYSCMMYLKAFYYIIYFKLYVVGLMGRTDTSFKLKHFCFLDCKAQGSDSLKIFLSALTHFFSCLAGWGEFLGDEGVCMEKLKEWRKSENDDRDKGNDDRKGKIRDMIVFLFVDMR